MTSAHILTSREVAAVAERAGALGLADGEEIDPDRVYHVDPALLVIGPNARLDPRPDDQQFAESIAEHGVLQVITCWRDELGQLVVIIGQRRTLVAARLGVVSVPITVTDQPGDVERISQQVVENDQRAGLSAAERSTAVEQLAAFGIPAGEIARRVSIPRDRVETALTVAASRPALEAAAVYDLTLDQAAVVAEFDTDPAAAAELLAAAAADGGRDFPHAAQRARDARRERDEHAAAAAALRATGVCVLDERPDWTGPAEHLETLRLTPAEHAGCPGHAAYLYRSTEVVDGHREQTLVPGWVCTDARGNGHRKRRPAGGQTDLDTAARAAERAETQRLSDEWRSAESVRRRWLHDLAQQKAPPPGAERFIAICLLLGDPTIAQAMGRESRHRLLRDLLGLDREAPDAGPEELTAAAFAELDELVGRLGTTTIKRTTLITTVVLLAAWEERTGLHTMRTPAPIDRRYLQQMKTWGYPCSAIERRVIDDDEEERQR